MNFEDYEDFEECHASKTVSWTRKQDLTKDFTVTKAWVRMRTSYKERKSYVESWDKSDESEYEKDSH